MSSYAHIYGRAVPVRRDRGAAQALRRLETLISAAFDGVLAWQDRAHSRDLLGRLDDRMLRDIGIDRSIAEQETTKPFWH
jgi:uncharacterized protein YjiS (DUF1127 family)